MNILAGMTTQNRRRTTLRAGSDAGDYMAKAIMRAINKYGDIKICAFNNSTYSFNYPYVAYTFGDGQNPVFEVITSVRVVRGALFLYAVGGHAEDPMSRYKELFKMELGHAGWVDGDDIAEALMAWAEDKKLWEGNKMGLDFRHMRREVEEEANYYLEDNVDTQYLKSSVKSRLRASDDFYQKVADELKTSVDPKKFKLKLITPDKIDAVADKAGGDARMLRGHIFFELSHPDLSTPLPMGAFFKDYDVGASVCASELERFATAQTFARHLKNFYEAFSVLIKNLDLYKRLDSNGVKTIKALMQGLQYIS